MPQPPPRGHPPRLSTLIRAMSLVVAVGIVSFLWSCISDGPVDPPAQSPDALQETAADKKGGRPTINDGALSIEDMLGDPLFHALILSIDEPSLTQPLLAAIDALASGKTAKATNLIGQASAEAGALEDSPLVEALILWSAVERYLEEADLM